MFAAESLPIVTLRPSSNVESIDFSAPAALVAQRLIGAILTVDGVGGRIVETEAYDPEEPASHAFCGPTTRNTVLFGPPAHVYVYRSYGIHWCLNFVCREEGHGAGVLIRAIEPLTGLDTMRQRRGLEPIRLLCSGPGRVGQALGITHRHNGMSLLEAPFHVEAPHEPAPVVSGPRIGITKAIALPWRFGLAASKFWSKPFPKHT
ncbi:UNVERIFIED_ORG: DNA-3-methyladenine glycosylase [Burkholderia sp. CF145]|uniref:DNA-3-methyladenine glycosylase n=1 Tax=Paraburkholderia hospita TaxID=169430 RepID=UPI000271CEF4|nr:DNA-3-methyladenine glycosylase [Paraburkholderia hospita]EUC11826.1 3-methyladenine DNA glycosylase [Burkholderia sp. BT03]SKD07416.1 DNA-3-methyladenine glycosylase [Paraburkholderia hospita]